MFLASIGVMKPQKSRKIIALNLLGSAGYIVCLLQWSWMLVILLPSILQSSMFEQWLGPSQAAPSTPAPVYASGGEVPGYVALIGLIVGIVFLLWALYVMLAKFPRTVARSGEKVTHTVVETVTPVIIEHIQLPKKQQREVPEIIMLCLKLLLIFAPLCLLLFAQGITIAMSFELIMLIGIVLFAWSFVFFALQYGVSKLLHIDYKKLR